MKSSKRNRERTAAAFTLAEMLAALALMAIVVPVVVQALRLASLAGEVSQRKALAVSLGERLINEQIVGGQTTVVPGSSGNQNIGGYSFHYVMRDEAWNPLSSIQIVNTPGGVNTGVVNQNAIHQLSVDVSFVAQGQPCTIHLATLYNTSQTQTAMQ